MIQRLMIMFLSAILFVSSGVFAQQNCLDTGSGNSDAVAWCMRGDAKNDVEYGYIINVNCNTGSGNCVVHYYISLQYSQDNGETWWDYSNSEWECNNYSWPCGDFGLTPRKAYIPWPILYNGRGFICTYVSPGKYKSVIWVYAGNCMSGDDTLIKYTESEIYEYIP